MGLEKSPPVL